MESTSFNAIGVRTHICNLIMYIVVNIVTVKCYYQVCSCLANLVENTE